MIENVADLLYRCRGFIINRNNKEKKLRKLNREKRKLMKEIREIDAQFLEVSQEAIEAMNKFFKRDKDRLKFYIRSLSVSAHISLFPGKIIVEWDYDSTVRITNTITGHTTVYKNESLKRFIEEIEKVLMEYSKDLPGKTAKDLK